MLSTFPMRREEGFTLLEICLAVAIGLLLLGLAVPSMAGLFAEQKLKRTFDDFDAFVRRAQMRSVAERRGFVMVWEPGAITLEPLEPTEEDASAEVDQFVIPEGGEFALQRPAALIKDPPMEWPFWRSGVCEPVIVSYRSDAGTWMVQYDPLTVRGTFLESLTP